MTIQNSKFRYTICAVFFSFQLSGCFSDGLIDKAKSEAYPKHEGTTFEKVLAGYDGCTDKKWSQQEMKTGEKYVEFTCISTNPVNFKAAMKEFVEKDIKELTDAIENKKKNAEIEKFQGLEIPEMKLNYAKDRVRTLTIQIEEEKKSGMNTERSENNLLIFQEEIEKLQTQIASLKSIDTEESRAWKQSVQEQLNKDLESTNSSLSRVRSAYRDGKLLIRLQWHFDTKGEITSYSTGVVFDFDEWKHDFDGGKVFSASIYENIHKGKSVLEALSLMFRGHSYNPKSPGELLYFASLISMPR